MLHGQLERGAGVVRGSVDEALHALQAERDELRAVHVVPEVEHRQVLGATDLVALRPGPRQQRRDLPPAERGDQGDGHPGSGQGAHRVLVGAGGEALADGLRVLLELGEVARDVVQVLVLRRIAHPRGEQLGRAGRVLHVGDARSRAGQHLHPPGQLVHDLRVAAEQDGPQPRAGVPFPQGAPGGEGLGAAVHLVAPGLLAAQGEAPRLEALRRLRTTREQAGSGCHVRRAGARRTPGRGARRSRPRPSRCRDLGPAPSPAA